MDAIVVSGSKGEQVFSLASADSVYRLIVETMQEAAVTVAAPDGTILFCNGQFATLLRTPLQIPVGKHISSFVEPSDLDTARRILQQAETGPVKARVSLQGTDGPIPVLASASPLNEATGKSICLVLSDLTELENSTSLVERLRVQQGIAETVMARLRIVGETAAALLKSPDPIMAMASISHPVAELLGCDIFLNYLVADDGLIKLTSSHGIPRKLLKDLQCLQLGQSVSGRVAETGKPLVLSAIQRSREPYLTLIRELGADAYVCVPLWVDDRVRGTLGFGARQRVAFTADDVGLVQTIADQAATALRRHMSEQALEAANAKLEEAVALRTAELAETVQRLEHTNAELELKMGQLRALALELSTAEQRERRRLADILHDDLQQILVAARYQMDSVAGTCSGPCKPTVDTVIGLLDKSIELTRSLTSEFSPATLHLTSFAETLRWLAGWARTRHGLTVVVEAEEVADIPDQIALLLAESVRELLFNVVKHSAVKTATITQRMRGNELFLAVADEGKGFDPAALSQARAMSSYGIFSIRERMVAIGGRLEIQSAPGNGSRFTLAVPREKLVDPRE